MRSSVLTKYKEQEEKLMAVCTISMCLNIDGLIICMVQYEEIFTKI